MISLFSIPLQHLTTQLTRLLQKLHYIGRKNITAIYELKHDILTDCLFTMCCHCCALIQQEREIRYRNEKAAGSNGGVLDRGEGYRAQDEINAIPPPDVVIENGVGGPGVGGRREGVAVVA